MESLESELERARALDTDELADAVERVGFECTRCGACCKAEADDPHTATVFPEEVRELEAETGYDWRDVARPMPYGLQDGGGETFEWALQTNSCGDCTFYEEDEGDGACTVHDDRPLICETYPFSVALGATSQPMGEAVDSVPLGGSEEGDGGAALRAHECEGLGRDIDRADAEKLARALKERAVRELEEAIAVRENYEPVESEGVVVHDSEGQKRSDGTHVQDERQA